MLRSPFEWLQEQFDDSKKRERLFIIVAIISQGMLFLGVILIIWRLQDDLRSILGPWRGFGMNYAIESGVLAQRAISNSLDYDKLWKSQFKERKKADIARRGIFALLGNRAFEYGMRKIKEGDEVDWEEINPSGWKKSLIYNTFYSIEMAKKTVWDSW